MARKLLNEHCTLKSKVWSSLLYCIITASPTASLKQVAMCTVLNKCMMLKFSTQAGPPDAVSQQAAALTCYA
jgi:hypothetical protein